MAEPDNLVLAHLRELRAEMQELRAEMNARFDASEARVGARFEALDRRLDAMQAAGIKNLGSFIGSRTIFERTMASVDEDLNRLRMRVDRDFAELAQRVQQLEAART